MPVVLIGLSHHTAPVEIRERFAIPDRDIPGVLAAVKAAGLAEEAVVLSTCNRVEIYAAVPSNTAEAAQRILEAICAGRGILPPEAAHYFALHEPASIEHLFKVASGLDSLVLGETEILGQLKKAYDLALQSGFTGKTLNRAFQRAFSVAKHIRTSTNIQRGSTSVGSVAVELTERIFSSLDTCNVMVIGAGDTSEKTARALQSRGARSILVSNRSFERAAALAGELGGRAIHFDDWESEFATLDILVSSTSAPHYILDRTRLESLLRHRSTRPLLLIDLAVPRDIDPKVEQLENVYLYDIDDLQSIADDYLRQRKEELSRCFSIIGEKVQALLNPGPSSFAPPGHWAR